MKTTNELMLQVKNELESRGFEMLSFFETQAQAMKDGKYEQRPVEGYDNYTRSYGFSIFFSVVHKHNNAEENISVDVSIYEWEANSGRRVAKERINTKMSDKAVANRINKIVEMYEAI